MMTLAMNKQAFYYFSLFIMDNEDFLGYENLG